MSLLDHVTLFVSDYPRSKAFYEAALAPLGVKLLMEYGQAAGFGREQKADFWIGAGPTSYHRPEHLRILTPSHIAFAARSKEEVDGFHRAALAAGGTDFGPPGPRPVYHAGYYGAFILDPDGHNVEAVIHDHPAPRP